MRNQYYPLTPEELAKLDAELAAAEHAYLEVLRKYQQRMEHATPNLADADRALQSRAHTQWKLAETAKDRPILSRLPLIDMKANLLIAETPELEQRLRKSETIKLRLRVHPYPDES